MIRTCGAAFMAAFALAGGAALAQEETLASILAKGAKRMSAEEAKAALTSGQLQGPFFRGEWLILRYRADGSMNGWTPTNGMLFDGDWTIDARGMQCMTYYLENNFSESLCRLWYRLGDVLYVLESESDVDRTQPVYKRTVTGR